MTVDNGSPKPITVILADDHAVVRSGIRDFLQQDKRLHIIAEASNDDQALALALAQNPDVLVLDIQMPGRNGIEVTKAVRASGSNMGILILTAYDDEHCILGALQAVATQLGISDRTVQGRMANVFSKLHAQSRTDAAMIGLRLGLIAAKDQ